ncbi:hypothetical protein H0262_05595 [Psychrobacter cryohalolentis]|uniref:hypothetical protein n=1 Tax=Psychrobacter sp. D2 TaxID=2759702 RepID=UPI0015E61E1D|nr:hypothetical protein [Psychrobacter sp. D2]MBA2057355.1 hypothetical protein [Psychrobacter sp. D2]
MRINLSRWLISAAVLSLTACTPVQDENYGYGYVVVHEAFWGAEHDTPYPFTTSGEITCSDHVELGRGVFFNPVGFTDESYVGTPLNKAAADIIKLSRITPNVPYRIKPGMDLSEAREIGLKVCDEQMG